MMRVTAAGAPSDVAQQLSTLAEQTGADELITVHAATSLAERLDSLRLTAEAWQSTAAAA